MSFEYRDYDPFKIILIPNPKLLDSSETVKKKQSDEYLKILIPVSN